MSALGATGHYAVKARYITRHVLGHTNLTHIRIKYCPKHKDAFVLLAARLNAMNGIHADGIETAGVTNAFEVTNKATKKLLLSALSGDAVPKTDEKVDALIENIKEEVTTDCPSVLTRPAGPFRPKGHVRYKDTYIP
jgi:hypothetical protein